MSDEDSDFFNSPRGHDSPKKYSWSKSRDGSETKFKAGNHNTVGQHVRESDRSDTAGTHSDGRQIIAKIPTAQLHRKDDSDSDSSYDGKYQRNTKENNVKNGSGNRSRDRNRSSGSNRSRSGSSSSSRSTGTSDSEYDQESQVINSSKSNSRNRTGSPDPSPRGDDYSSVAVRPKTGVKSRRGTRVVREKTTKSREGSDRYSDSSSSESGSDSDITDVSPLNSPQRATPKTSPKKVKIVDNLSSEKSSSMHKDLVSYKHNSKNAGGYEHLLSGDKDAVNLKVLMHAILEMERDKEDERVTPKQFRVPRAGTASIAESTCSRTTVSSRRNMSFNNHRVRDIDRENQRLMNEILKFATKKKTGVKPKKQPVAAPAPQKVVTSAAVNRMREQERIDRENRAMLKRLEGASATKTLRKDVLDQELNSTTYVGVPLGYIHASKGKTVTSPNPYSGGRARSAASRSRSISQLGSDTCSVMSDAHSTYTSSTVRSRPTSAKSTSSTMRAKQRPKSAHVMTNSRPARQRRPAWEDGW